MYKDYIRSIFSVSHSFRQIRIMKTLVSILRDSIVKTIKTLGRKRTVKDLHT